ncbi:hypothetical protein EUX98_g4136 [Antrodiella citrinella]|uniref:NAD(P)-binding domain-containing protein n=1 Tax=Antrodiella citrinella TaxID=2447956 RepID=A0A4S4MUS6_9APHY|nr:hypothetical protein EUX98_g4136 [Antrodiella citrinella]
MLLTYAAAAPGKSALLLGASGEVGRHLLQELLQDPQFTRVGEYGRRVTPADKIEVGKGKLEQKTVNFDKIEEAGLKDGKWDVVYITLGTTRALAGSAAAFEKIDREYVINAAREAKVDDPSHQQRLVYCSSGAANPHSLFLYTRSKGLTELGLAGLGYSETIVFRPGLLTDTQRPDPRFMESLLQRLFNLRSSWVTDYAIPTTGVATAMRIAGELGTAKLPAEAKATTAGGDTPFTLIDNLGIRALANDSTDDCMSQWLEVTGTSSELGKCLAECVLERGHIIVATLRNPTDLNSLKAKYPPEQLLVLKLDVSRNDDIAAAFTKVQEVYGRLDVVVNDAGYNIVGEIEDTPEEAAHKLFDVNFL